MAQARLTSYFSKKRKLDDDFVFPGNKTTTKRKKMTPRSVEIGFEKVSSETTPPLEADEAIKQPKENPVRQAPEIARPPSQQVDEAIKRRKERPVRQVVPEIVRPEDDIRAAEAFDDFPSVPISPLPPSPKPHDEQFRDDPSETPAIEKAHAKVEQQAGESSSLPEVAQRASKKLHDAVPDRASRLQKLAQLQRALKNIKKVPDTTGIEEREEEHAPSAYPFQDRAPTLTLPHKHKLLEEMFRSTDVIVSMLYNRKESCTFDKIKKGVEEILRKKFELRNLAQIKSIYESAYAYELETLPQNTGASKYRLLVTPVLESHRTENATGSSEDALRHMNSSMLLSRRQAFHVKLTDLVKDHHEKFLLNLTPPVLIDKNKVQRWHPMFKVDAVPDIVPADLPTVPDRHRTITAQELLHKAKDVFDKRIHSALTTIASKKFDATIANVAAPAPTTVRKTPSSSSSLKRIPADLLAKIRAKEAASMEKKMTRDPETERKIALMSKLPEFSRTLRNYFLTDKKAAILMESVVERLERGSASMVSSASVEEHIRLLCDVVPNWIRIVPIKRGCYVKINKEMDMNGVVAEIHRKQQDLTKGEQSAAESLTG